MAVARVAFFAIGMVLLITGLVGVASNQFIVAGGGGTGATTGNLVGYVTNQTSGLGIVGAHLNLLQSGVVKYGATTTTNGYYQFLSIVSGGYAVQVTATGYQQDNSSVTVPSGTTAVFSAQLAPITSRSSSSSTTCSPTPSGTGCNVPAPPPGTTGPPPTSPGGNATSNTTAEQITHVISPPLSVILLVFGVVFIVLGAVEKA